MFTPDPTDLVAEYLYTEPTSDGTVENTEGTDALNGTIVAGGTYPLQASSDVPPNFQGSKSLDFDVLREVLDKTGSIAAAKAEVSGGSDSDPGDFGDAQFVQVDGFPDPPENELTVEAWVKPDYIRPDRYPTGSAGAEFGADPQPICKECSYYMFMGSLQVDRNLMFTHIPGVQAGIPKPDEDAGAKQEDCDEGVPPPEDIEPCGIDVTDDDDEDGKKSGSGGIMSKEGKVPGGEWTHIAATFTDVGTGSKPYLMTLYVNGEKQALKEEHDLPCPPSAKDPLRYSERTNNPIFKPGATGLRLGMFRQVLDNLDYQYSGKLCGVRIYHRALTRDEICKDIAADVCAPEVSAPTPEKVVFPDIPVERTHSAAAVFEVRSPCRVTLEISEPTVDSGPGEFGRPLGDTVEIPGAEEFDRDREARVWISHTAPSTPGRTTTGSVTVTVRETGEEFTLDLEATSTDRPQVAVAMSLDKSGSMGFDSGVGAPLERRLDVLRFSVKPFVDLLENDNEVGIVAFDEEPHDVLPMTQTDRSGKITIRSEIAAYEHNREGFTAIGDGLEAAQGLLDGVSGFDSEAVVLLTDGHETASKYINDVEDRIHDSVYAIGLGTANQVQPKKLRQLTNDKDGYILMTGDIADNEFLLAKYYLQILTGVTNKNVVCDPDGYLTGDEETTVEFQINETDLEVDVILLSLFPDAFRFFIETPDGDTLTPYEARTTTGASFNATEESAFYRFTLPLPIGDGASEGTWRVHLQGNAKWYETELPHLEQSAELVERLQTRGARFSLNVHARSDLQMDARLYQNSNEPDATLRPRVNLTEYGLPVEDRADVRARIDRPDGTETTASLPEVEPGIFETEVTATIPGVYRFRILANGRTLRDTPFDREQFLTGAVWQGGDQPAPSSSDTKRELCELVDCLLDEGAIGDGLRERLTQAGIDVDATWECLRRYCRDESTSGGPGDDEFSRIFRPEILQDVRALIDNEEVK